MAVSAVRSVLLGRRERSSVEMAMSTMLETGGKRTWERPLRELRGVLEDNDDTEELESEPWEEGGGPPLATVEDIAQLQYSMARSVCLKYNCPSAKPYKTAISEHNTHTNCCDTHLIRITQGLQLLVFFFRFASFASKPVCPHVLLIL